VVLHSLPLFPLGTVLYPQSILPLRIFEVRYLDMVNKCLRTGAPFGVVSLTQGIEVQKPLQAETFASVGTLTTVDKHESPQPGLKLIQCNGRQRFRILKKERLKYGIWIADIEHIENDMAVDIPNELENCSSTLRKVIAKLESKEPGLSVSASAESWNDCGWVSNRWCELLPIPLEMKQRMLELDNPLIRLELISDLLDKLHIA
jgi:uncharacterized protein